MNFKLFKKATAVISRPETDLILSYIISLQIAAACSVVNFGSSTIKDCTDDQNNVVANRKFEIRLLLFIQWCSEVLMKIHELIQKPV